MVPRTFFAVATLCLPGALARAGSGQPRLHRPELAAGDASAAATASLLFDGLTARHAGPQATRADLVAADVPPSDADAGFYRLVAR